MSKNEKVSEGYISVTRCGSTLFAFGVLFINILLFSKKYLVGPHVLFL